MSARQLRNIYAWLERCSKQNPNPRETNAHTAGCMLLALGTPLVGLGLGFAVSAPAGFLGALVTIPAAIGAWLYMAKRASKPRSDAEAQQINRRVAVMSLNGLKTNRKLHKWVDPTILQVLEAGAYHWLRVRDVLDSPDWHTPQLSGRWRELRDQAVVAADQAMQDLAIFANNCSGKPQRERREDINDAFNSLTELNIHDALGGLKVVIDSDWQHYSHQSPNARAVFEPARQIAERLKQLGDAVEQMNFQRAQESIVVNDQPQSVDSIDLLLSELRATQQAEVELSGGMIDTDEPEEHIRQGH